MSQNDGGARVAASVTVYRIADMHAKGRKQICAWLRGLADDLQREPQAFAKTFRARYYYADALLAERGRK